MSDYRLIEVAPYARDFGAEVRGLRLSPSPSPEVVDEIRRAWARHAVLSFTDQPLSIEEQEAFTLLLGNFGEDPFIEAMPDHPHTLELRREPDEKATNFGAGWHSDWSFQPRPPAGTLLHAKVVPPVGGDTLFADCAAAYEALSPAMQRLCDGLGPVHSARLPYGRDGVYARETEARTMRIVTSEAAERTHVHPLVRVHPDTGRRSLFCSPVYTVGIDGMTPDESYAILGFLFRHMTDERFVHRHRWKPDTLLLWDNRCTLHFAEGGYDGHLRVMHRTTLSGAAPVGPAGARQAGP
jgi:taurine dioxygenase